MYMYIYLQVPAPFIVRSICKCPRFFFQVDLCCQCIDWAKSENRVFLRQALEARLVSLYVDRDCETQALSIANPLLKELKKIDDKALLVEVWRLAVLQFGLLSLLPSLLPLSPSLSPSSIPLSPSLPPSLSHLTLSS